MHEDALREKMRNKEIIPIVFSMSKSYVNYGYVAIYSLIKNADKQNKYLIYILVTNIGHENIDLLESLTQDNVEVKCIDIYKFTKNITLKESVHVTIETYYRLFIPLVLSQYERVLYLDTDICVNSDLSELYHCDLKGKAIAAALDVPCIYIRDHSKDIGLPNYKKAFSAGVLVIDIKKFEEERIREKCLSVLHKDYRRKYRKLIYADQDALNVVLYDNVTIIDNTWNVQWQYSWRMKTLFKGYRDKYLELIDNAKIIHYAGDRKPWKYPLYRASDVFWKHAKETVVFEKIVNDVITEAREEVDRLACFNGFQFPYGRIPYGSNVIIYGAGDVGRRFVRQNVMSLYANIVLWADKNVNKIKLEDFPLDVCDPKAILNAEYDYLIIAIDASEVAREVKAELIKLGVPDGKIVWEKYFENWEKLSKSNS